MNRNTSIAAALCCTFLVSVIMTPTEKIADKRAHINLEKIIPAQFGDWKMDERSTITLVNPQLQTKLNRIYNQTLTRTYIDGSGNRIMLSIAYGGDQSDAMQVHKPEICYPSQGMPIISKQDDLLQLAHGALPVRRLIAQRANRYEPITYWIRIGDHAVVSSFRQKLVQMAYTLSGEIPDGLLFRTSTLGLTEEESFRLQNEFINALLGSLDDQSVNFIAGNFS